ncbi:ATP synthase F0 sector subunit B [Sporosarcina newyorkensis 2681]|uniref:ATP synthase subunit b n=2 Tax=Sporosarcina newyorkensis TaxID=759851 RepID=A0A1T4XXU4_9BACL|nr:ATP synthase F0 sector subunit B [Sporosarcina newyorkensis 2681]SKA94038.1 F-type H+-transporting ATPase subunit b [Sporosarcina newyorkensis]
MLDTFVLLSANADAGFLASLNQRLNLGDIIVTVVFFTILMVLLKKFAWGPLMGIMDQRAQLIATEIEQAEKSRQESAKLLEEQRALLKEARDNAQSIVENAKKQGDTQREELITAARAEVSRMKEAATLEIATEKEKAVAAVREEFVSLSILAASKVLGKEISEDDNRALIEETIVKAGEGR